MEQENRLSQQQQGLSRHPFALLIVLCLLANALFDVTSNRLISVEGFFFMFGAAGLFFWAWLVFYRKKPLHVTWAGVLTAAAAILLCIAFVLYLTRSANPVFFLLITGLCVLLVIGIALKVCHALTEQRLLLLLFAAGFLLRLCYILYTSVATRQHDVWHFGGDKGHAAYIEYFYNGLRLPDFDPSSRWQFYHPPLHHVTAALWMRLNVALGMSYTRACESIQILTLFYSSCCMIISYKIFRQLQFRGWALVLPCALICFYPTFIIMSGSINNDMLSVTLAFAAVLAALRWYQRPTIPRILVIALCIGGSMMAKLSGVLLAPAVALLFVVKLVRERKSWKKYLLQFVLFGAVCIPLGLWWGILNLIRWELPINYVPLLGGSDSDQYVGNYSIWQRLFGFTGEQFRHVYDAWGSESGASYYEYNVFQGIFKTSLFGEYNLFYSADPASLTTAQFARYQIGLAASYVLYWVNILLIALSGVYGIAALIRKKYLSSDRWITAFFWVLWAVVLLMYIQFSISYPHTCTQNFRYAVPTLLCGAVFFGKGLQWTADSENVVLRRSMTAVSVVLTVVFCLASATVYTALGA